jgi:hypothetical protein
VAEKLWWFGLVLWGGWQSVFFAQEKKQLLLDYIVHGCSWEMM